MTRLTMEMIAVAVKARPGLTAADLIEGEAPGFVEAMLQAGAHRGLIDGRVELDAEWHYYPVITADTEVAA